MKSVAIVGFGRFGKTLIRLLKNDFEVGVYDVCDIESSNDYSIIKKIKDIYTKDVIFYCVPISDFEKVIAEHAKFFTKNNLLFDVLSVKVHPQKVLEKHLKSLDTQAILTHPLFGPDSSKNGFSDLPMVMNQFKASKANYTFWKKYFESNGLRIIEMSAEEHDTKVAYSQGVTHFIGRILGEMNLVPTEVDTVGAKKLLEVMEQTCNDTWQLFSDLQSYNHSTKQMRVDVGDAFDKVFNMLLPERLDKEVLHIGIQGGVGSFNEEAAMYYLKRNDIKNYKIKYLYTTQSVLDALRCGEIDRGQFAIHNSIGGVVRESIKAMADFKFDIVEEFAIKISHALMIHSDATLDKIYTIMTHPQVLKQCKNSLAQKYGNLKLTSGEGELIDHAMVAKNLSEGNISPNIATMGSKVLAKIYNLKVVEDNLQDATDNFTSFLWVKRKA